MATTTNYGWTTPDDTGLVKDGASAIRSLGTAVDTTTKNLNPETTLGDIAYRSSTANVKTRLGIGSTGQVLTVSGGVPTWASAAGGLTFQAWTPTYTNLTVGNGTVIARYGTGGKYTFFEFVLTFGSTTSFSGQPKFSLPTTPKNLTASGSATNLATAGYMDFETRYWLGYAEIKSVNCELIYFSVNTSKISRESVDANNPMVWGTNDTLFVVGHYEEA